MRKKLFTYFIIKYNEFNSSAVFEVSQSGWHPSAIYITAYRFDNHVYKMWFEEAIFYMFRITDTLLVWVMVCCLFVFQSHNGAFTWLYWSIDIIRPFGKWNHLLIWTGTCRCHVQCAEYRDIISKVHIYVLLQNTRLKPPYVWTETVEKHH